MRTSRLERELQGCHICVSLTGSGVAESLERVWSVCRSHAQPSAKRLKLGALCPDRIGFVLHEMRS